MASADLVAVPAASHYVSFDDLHLGRSNQEVVCRLLRFWDAQNVRRDGEFLGIVLLLLDEKNTLIHAFIPASLAVHYRRDLNEGSVFKIDHFEVSRCTKMYKVTDHPFVIRFLPHTTLTQLDAYTPKIATEKFMLRKLDHLQALANTNLELPDVVGQIRFVQGSNLGDAASTQRIVIRLLIEPYVLQIVDYILTSVDFPPPNFLLRTFPFRFRSVTVCVSLWDDAAATFRAHLGTETAVLSTMLVTTVNPKLFGGALFLNSTPATRFYFDSDIHAIAEFNKSMGIEASHTFTRVDTTQAISKMETLTIRELYVYISQSTEQVQEADFLCNATVVGVLKRDGWSYVACAHCSRKLTLSGSALRCNKCVYPIATCVRRYRVELGVTDGITNSTFVVFDSEMTKLTCKTAATLLTETAGNDEGDLPQELVDLAGKQFRFQIKVTPFNFTPQHRTFTVARMTEVNGPPANPEELGGNDGPPADDHGAAPAVKNQEYGDSARAREEDNHAPCSSGGDLTPSRKRSRD